tara:strand:+ start:576 stop:785 length:210 start_codon:yes stop_codon:yes gene_type:complete
MNKANDINLNIVCFADNCKDQNKKVIIRGGKNRKFLTCPCCGSTRAKVIGISNGSPMVKNADSDGRTRL